MHSVLRFNRKQCLAAMISAIVVIVCVCIGVVMNLTTLYDENFDQMGLKTFHMFTVNSNILAAITLSMVIPYTIDGLRKNNYHLPNWVVVLNLMGVTGVALTFLISLCLLAPVKGFVLIFTGSRFFLHGVCPILAIVSFCFFISDHRISLKESFWAPLPTLVYAILYFVMVVLVGEEHGGWKDFYGFATRLPIWLPSLLIMPLTFGIATVLRLLHNGSYDRRKVKEAAMFEAEYAGKDVAEMVRAMARDQREARHMADIVVPSRIISLMIKHSEDEAHLDECCKIFVEEYLKK